MKPMPSLVVTLFFLVLAAPPAWGAEDVKAGAPAPETMTAPMALDAGALDALRGSFTLDAASRAAMNALARNPVDELAVDAQAKARFDGLFSDKVKAKGITNQKRSGRCWLFAALNTMRPVMIAKYELKGFEFSYNYLFFYDKLEKANTFLENVIAILQGMPASGRDFDRDRELEFLLKSPAGDGGQWNMAVDLVEKYGLLPLQVMPENAQSEDSRAMNRVLARKLRQGAHRLRTAQEGGAALAALRDVKAATLKDVYRILALHLGVPPQRFTWRYEDKDGKVSEPRELSPLDFYKEIVSVSLGDYVHLMHSPNHPLGKTFRIQWDRSLIDSGGMTFANLPIQDLKAYALAAVQDGEAVWFGADVGKDHDRQGYLAPEVMELEALYGVDLSLDKQARLVTRDSIPNHAMALIGVDMAKDAKGNGEPRPVKWLVENSWGEKRGRKGFWTLSDAWFDEYVYSVIVHKKRLPKSVLSLFDAEPEDLPFWDPMWSW